MRKKLILLLSFIIPLTVGAYLLPGKVVRPYLLSSLGEGWNASRISFEPKSISFEDLRLRTPLVRIRVNKAVLPMEDILHILGIGHYPKPLHISGLSIYLKRGRDGRWHFDEILRMGKGAGFKIPMILEDGILVLISNKGEELLRLKGLSGIIGRSGTTLEGEVDGSPISISITDGGMVVLAKLRFGDESRLLNLANSFPTGLEFVDGEGTISLLLDNEFTPIKASSFGSLSLKVRGRDLYLKRFIGHYSGKRISANANGSAFQIPFQLGLEGTTASLEFEGRIGKGIEISGTADLRKPEVIKLKQFEVRMGGRNAAFKSGYIEMEGPMLKLFGKDGLSAMVGIGDGGGNVSISAPSLSAFGRYRFTGETAILANLEWEGKPSLLRNYGIDLEKAKGTVTLSASLNGYKARIEGEVLGPKLRGISCEKADFNLDYGGGMEAGISGKALFFDGSIATFSGTLDISRKLLSLAFLFDGMERKLKIGLLGEANGKPRFEGILSGPLDRPRMSGEAKLLGLRVGGRSIPDFASDLEWDGKVARLSRFSLGGFSGEGGIVLGEKEAFADITFKGWDPVASDMLKPLMPWIRNPKAEGSVHITWEGERGPMAIGDILARCDIGSLSASFSANDEGLRIEKVGIYEADGGAISADLSVFRKDGSYRVSGEGVLTEFSEISGRISASVEIKLGDERFLDGFWNGEGIVVKGKELGKAWGSFSLGDKGIELSWTGSFGTGSFRGKVGPKVFKDTDGIISLLLDLTSMGLPFGIKGKGGVMAEIRDGKGRGTLEIRDGALSGIGFSQLVSPMEFTPNSLFLNGISIKGEGWDASGTARIWFEDGFGSIKDSRIDGGFEFHGLPLSILSGDLPREGRANGRISIGGKASDPVLYGDVEVYGIEGVGTLKGNLIALGDRVYLRDLKGSSWGEEDRLEIAVRRSDGGMKARADIKGWTISAEGKGEALEATVSSKDFGSFRVGLRSKQHGVELVPVKGEPYPISGFLNPSKDGVDLLISIGGGLEVRGTVSKKLDLSISGFMPIPSGWSEFISALEPALVEGRVYGDPEKPEANGSLLLKKGIISGLPFDLMNISWKLSGKDVLLERIRVWKLGSYDAMASGRITMKKGPLPGNAEVSISLRDFSGDLHILKSISNRISYAYGSVDEMRFDISGPLSSPKVTGRIRSKDGEIGFDFLPDPVSSPEIDFEVEGKVLKIKGLRALYQLQPIRCEGYIGLEKGGKMDLRISAEGREGKPFLLEFPGVAREGEYVKILLISPLLLGGTVEMPEIHGTVLITDTSFTYPMRRGSGTGHLHWDVLCIMGQNVWIEGPWVRVNVKGSLRLKGEDARLLGKLEIIRGMATFLGTDFKITSGSIECTEEEKEPYVEGKGEAMIEGTKFTISIGRAPISRIKPEITTDNPFLSRAEAMGILAAGKEIPPDSIEGELARVIGGQIGSSLLDPFQKEVKRFLGLEMFQVRTGFPATWSIYPREGLPIRGFEVMAEKYLAEGLYLSYTVSREEPLKGGWKSKLEMDYEITEHIRWRAGVGKDERFILLELRYPF